MVRSHNLLAVAPKALEAFARLIIADTEHILNEADNDPENEWMSPAQLMHAGFKLVRAKYGLP